MVKQIGVILAALAWIIPGAALAQQSANPHQPANPPQQSANPQQQPDNPQQRPASPQQQPASPQQQPASPQQQPAEGSRVKLPQGAKIVATVEADQVRAFPEQQSGKGKIPPEEIVGVRAVDRVYQTDRAYADVVKFFDQEATQGGNKQVARDTTQTSTAWAITLPQGRTVNVIARNTRPTTIEVVSANDVVAEIQQSSAPGH